MLYQLKEGQFKRLSEDYVVINGPHDKYGRIIKVDNGVYLISGLGKVKPV